MHAETGMCIDTHAEGHRVSRDSAPSQESICSLIYTTDKTCFRRLLFTQICRRLQLEAITRAAEIKRGGISRPQKVFSKANPRVNRERRNEMMTTRLEANCWSLSVCSRSCVWSRYRDESEQLRSGKERRRWKKEKKRLWHACVEAARQGTRCSRQRLMWFFYTAKGGSVEREEQTVWKCEKSWELDWMDINTSHPPRIVFSLRRHFCHQVLTSAQSTPHALSLNPSPKLNLP